MSKFTLGQRQFPTLGLRGAYGVNNRKTTLVQRCHDIWGFSNLSELRKIGFDKRFIVVFRGLDISQISVMFRSIPFCSVF